jgi:hypothetical protein
MLMVLMVHFSSQQEILMGYFSCLAVESLLRTAPRAGSDRHSRQFLRRPRKACSNKGSASILAQNIGFGGAE